MDAKILESAQVCMRPLDEGDIAPILELASAPEIAANTFVPHPYPPEAAVEFVQKCRENWRYDEDFVFAIIDKSGGQFAGAMGVHPKEKHNLAEVGYWLGTGFWGRGLATAALRLVVQFGFEQLGLNRIEARHFVGNPASGRVMQKAGMRREGRHRQAVRHRDQYKDVISYAILREDYAKNQKDRRG